MSIYVTWSLYLDNGYLIGPEDNITSQGISIEPIWSIGSPEDGGVLIARLSSLPEGMDNWNLCEISAEEVRKIISDNFTPTPENADIGIKEYTLEMALNRIL
jgi:hypothetical protein